MTDEQFEETCVSRIKRSTTAMKILIILAAISIAALLIFALAAKFTGMLESSPEASLLGLTVLMLCATVFFAGAFTSLLIASFTLKKLMKANKAKKSAAKEGNSESTDSNGSSGAPESPKKQAGVKNNSAGDKSSGKGEGVE